MRAIGKIPLEVAGDLPECRELRRELDVFPEIGSSDDGLRFVFFELLGNIALRILYRLLANIVTGDPIGR